MGKVELAAVGETVAEAEKAEAEQAEEAKAEEEKAEEEKAEQEKFAGAGAPGFAA